MSFTDQTRTHGVTIEPSATDVEVGELHLRGLGVPPNDYRVGFKPPNSIAATVIWKLPSADAVGVLTSDGAKNLSFQPAGAGLTSVIGITVDGGGSAPTTGIKGIIQVPFGCTITGWSLIADQAGSASVDICFHSGSAPPSAPSIPNTTTDKISASAPVALSSAQSAAGGSSAISTWTVALSEWGSILFNLDSITTCQRITLELEVTRT